MYKIFSLYLSLFFFYHLFQMKHQALMKLHFDNFQTKLSHRIDVFFFFFLVCHFQNINDLIRRIFTKDFFLFYLTTTFFFLFLCSLLYFILSFFPRVTHFCLQAYQKFSFDTLSVHVKTLLNKLDGAHQIQMKTNPTFFLT